MGRPNLLREYRREGGAQARFCRSRQAVMVDFKGYYFATNFAATQCTRGRARHSLMGNFPYHVGIFITF
jgi:hypothetical protein